MTITSDSQPSPSSDGDDNPRIEPLTGSLSANTGQQLLAARLAELRANKKAVETEEKKISAELKELMLAASAAKLIGENGVVVARITLVDQTRVDSKKLEVLHPEIFEACTKTKQIVQIRTA